jgi:hypothetical protein
MNKMKTAKLFLPLTAALALVTTSQADMIDMTAIWTENLGPASAVATFTLDTSAIPNPGSVDLIQATIVQNFQLTVSGASNYSTGIPSGNGVFQLSDFNGFWWANYGPIALDFHRELVGQDTGSGGAMGNQWIKWRVHPWRSHSISPQRT